MQTKIEEKLLENYHVREAEKILRACVHCGFCTATCPTYQLIGDELDGPRGRIYLIKQALEESNTTDKTLRHLDRCLSCRSCETTCPSGVRYHKLLQSGKAVVEARVPRPLPQRLLRWGMRALLPYPSRFRPFFRLGMLFRPLMPAVLRQKMPVVHAAGERPARSHARQVILFEGCVQSVVAQSINAATSRVLDTREIAGAPVDGQVVRFTPGDAGIGQRLLHADGLRHPGRAPPRAPRPLPPPQPTLLGLLADLGLVGIGLGGVNGHDLIPGRHTSRCRLRKRAQLQ